MAKMLLKTVKLTIDKENYNPIQCKQGDTGRYLLFQILNGGVPFSLQGRTVRASAKKQDGTKIFNDLIVVDATKGMCELQLTSQMLFYSGWLKVELTIYEGKDTLSLIPFTLDIMASIRDDEAVESTNEFSALTIALSKADEWDRYFEETSGHIEEKYTVRLNNIDGDIDSIKEIELPKYTKRTEVKDLLVTKADIIEVFLRENGIDINDFTERTRRTFLEAQGIDVNYVLGEDNVRVENTFFIDKANLLYNKEIQKGKLVNVDGTVVQSSVYDSYIDIVLEKDLEYMYNGNGTDSETRYMRTLVFYDENKVMTRSKEFVSNMCSFKLEGSEKYISFSIKNTSVIRELFKADNLNNKMTGIKVLGNEIRDLNVTTKEASFIDTENELYNLKPLIERTIMTNGEIIAGTLYNSYIYEEFEPGVEYHYFGDVLKTIRNIVYYDMNKQITRFEESVSKFKLNENEKYISIVIAKANTINKISKNSDFKNLLKGVKVDGKDIENLKVETYNTSYIDPGDILPTETVTLNTVVMPDGSVVVSPVYNSYLYMTLEKQVDYYYTADVMKTLRTVTFYDVDKIMTRCLENVSTFKMNLDEVYVSISVKVENTVNKLSKNDDFSNRFNGVNIASSDVVGLEDVEAYDQSLNTFDDVQFESIITKGELPKGTLLNPPVGLKVGDVWADTTDSATNPIFRVKI